MTISKTKNTEIAELAMSDELFTPESISLEPQYPPHDPACRYWKFNVCNCHTGKSLTVRLPKKEKHFTRKHFATIPAWNEDYEYEKECLLI